MDALGVWKKKGFASKLTPLSLLREQRENEGGEREVTSEETVAKLSRFVVLRMVTERPN